MTNRLLNRQVRLLEQLASPATIFGEEASEPADPVLQGIDHALLRLEARFCCNKRIEKVIAAFPRTCEIFGAAQGLILRGFVAANPQTDVSSLVNARQFYAFLLACWERDPPEPAYLSDVAACELAMVEARNFVEDRAAQSRKRRSSGPKRDIRRRGSVVLLRCAHDIRSIIEEGVGNVVPPRRDTLLVAVLPAKPYDVKIFEVARVVFDLLARLDDWTDPIALSGAGDIEKLIRHLSEHEFIEVRN
ncbi:MAG TPA: hypothetical protein VH684_22405 [Xanthobacteraceae bacterium]|jgi:hypothetical protein